MDLEQFDEAFDTQSWHGPNLRGSLRGVTAAKAAWRPAPGRHNIWEVTVHAAYWKYVARRRLTGAKRGTFAVKGSNWFERPSDMSEKAWKADVAMLVDEHRLLREAIANLLQRRAKPSPQALRLIRGIAAHDLYHAGQIQILKRLCP